MVAAVGFRLGMLFGIGGLIAIGLIARPATESSDKSALVADMGDFWVNRATYPTGHYNPAWQVAAATQMRTMASATPAGIDLRRSLNALDPLQFTALGPRPLVSGSQATAGRVNVVIGHPGDASIAWLGADGGGIWKTNNCCDANTSWTIKTDIPTIQASAISDMTLDPNDPNVLYAATGDLRFGSFSFGSNGVLKSTDGGETWVVKGEAEFNPFFPPSAGGFPQYQAIGQVEVDPNDGNKVIVGTKTGLWLSFDGGDQWTGPCLTNTFTSQRQDITGIVLRDNGLSTQIIAAVGTRGFETPVQPDLNQNGANGVYRGTMPASGCPLDFALVSRGDNGWPAGSGGGVPIPTNTLGRIDLAIAPSDSNVIYAQVAKVDAGSPVILGVWRSGDAGDSWQQTTVGDIPGAGTQSWYNAGLTVSPIDPNNVILSAFATFRSSNGGSGWSNLGSVPDVDHHGRSFVASDPNRLLIGTDGGVFYTANAQASPPTWISLNNTLNTIEFYSGGISANFGTANSSGAVGGAQDNSMMVSSWSNGNFAAQSWAVRNGGDGFFGTIEPILGQRWYYSSQNGNIRVTSTAQGTGTVGAAPSGWAADRKSFLTNFDLYRFGGESTGCPAATGCGHIIAGSFRVWESVSGGSPTSSWVPNSPDLTKGTSVPGNLGQRAFINQVAYALSTPTVAIAGTNDGNVAIGFGLGQNLANSATWVALADGNAVLPNRPVLDVFLDPVDPLIGYAAIGGFAANTPGRPGHVYQVTCTAGCASFAWRDVSGNLPDIPANSVIVNPNLPSQVFVGTDWGLFFTDDIDAAVPVWAKHAGLPSVMVWDLTVDRGFTTLAAWTRSRGAWVWPLPTELPNPDVLFRDGFE
ncbi:MAG: WD40/YVTN/BNR-like repeat-containing protein [Lysobacterales bacterium]